MTHAQITAAVKASLLLGDKTERHACYPKRVKK